MATQTDANVKTEEVTESTAATEQTTFEPDYSNDPRDAIAEQHAQFLAEQEKEAGIEQPDNTQTQIDAQIEQANVIDDPSKYMVKVKVDGQELEMSLNDVVSGFQRKEASDKRFQEAARLRKEAEMLLQNKPQQTESVTHNEVADDVKSSAKAVISSLLDGDEENAAETLAKMIAGRGNATQNLSTYDVVSKVTQQLEVDSALQEFENEYADLLADPHLTSITNEYLAVERESGEHKTYSDMLKTAGNATREWLAQRGVTSANPTTTIQNNSRVAIKQRLEQIPTVSASAGNAQEVEESAADVIAQMKKERGYIT